MEDKFSTYLVGLDDPAANFFAVTPNDSADLAIATRGIMAGVAGNIEIDGVLSGVAVVVPVLAGIVYPFRVKKVYAANTTATSC